MTFLWRAAGSPAPEISAMPFTDVPVRAATTMMRCCGPWRTGSRRARAKPRSGRIASCTRAQIVTFLYRAFRTPAGGDAAFADTAPNAYYAEAVRWAVATGVTTGTSNKTYSPNADCTRAEIVTFLWRCKKTG
ncbi:MAG: S-layer homology domain-containing protein [Oscillospiraceae bacterium]